MTFSLSKQFTTVSPGGAATITDRLSTALDAAIKLERHLGEGGMANFYLAENLKHHCTVAGAFQYTALAG